MILEYDRLLPENDYNTIADCFHREHQRVDIKWNIVSNFQVHSALITSQIRFYNKNRMVACINNLLTLKTLIHI